MNRSAKPRRVEKTFWCEEAGRMVTVEFVREGSLLGRKEKEVLSCSGFERPAEINCRRECLDAVSRRSWPDVAIEVQWNRS